MRRRLERVKVVDVTEQREPTRFELLIERAAEPIEGVLVADGAEWRFAGWAGFAAALQRALATAGGEGTRRRA